jgi:hypothetical protein
MGGQPVGVPAQRHASRSRGVPPQGPMCEMLGKLTQQARQMTEVIHTFLLTSVTVQLQRRVNYQVVLMYPTWKPMTYIVG